MQSVPSAIPAAKKTILSQSSCGAATLLVAAGFLFTHGVATTRNLNMDAVKAFIAINGNFGGRKIIEASAGVLIIGMCLTSELPVEVSTL